MSKFLINSGIKFLPAKYRPLAKALNSVLFKCLEALRDREVTKGEIKAFSSHAIDEAFPGDDSRVVFKVGE